MSLYTHLLRYQKSTSHQLLPYRHYFPNKSSKYPGVTGCRVVRLSSFYVPELVLHAFEVVAVVVIHPMNREVLMDFPKVVT